MNALRGTSYTEIRPTETQARVELRHIDLTVARVHELSSSPESSGWSNDEDRQIPQHLLAFRLLDRPQKHRGARGR
jgi:hypothetical protein